MAPALSSSYECLSHLLCAEDASNVVGCWDEDESKIFCEEEEGFGIQHFPDFPVPDDDEIRVLVRKESQYMPGKSYVQSYQNLGLDFTARQNAIGWILKVHGSYNFGPLTAYLSINYLDRFLSRNPLPKAKVWMLQLLSVACLSLAAKMEETQVPLLLDLQAEEPDFLFEPRTIQRMELLVLSTLEWRMLSVTPFSFVDYFLQGGGGRKPPPRAMVARANELIFNTHTVLDFLEHRPSAIAAAAVICAAEEVLPLEAAQYKETILSCSLVEKEWVFGSYNLIQEVLIEKFSTPNKAKSASSSIPQSPVGVLDAFCLSNNSNNTSLEASLSVNLYASVAAKRRKLNDYCNTWRMFQHSTC